jgi:crotonobetainyl-CoA:carnitine CoA-transferase CaiB-like acyl-CoA transferase
MQPLNGLKILDFTTLLPGPYATQLLADMGADVLRIEAINRPDLLQMMPPKVGKVSAAHAAINRNKSSLAMDLKQPAAKAIIEALLSDYDIVIEQFRPGVMQRLGLDYEALRALQPKLIYCSVTGYGQTGPLRERAGHDINYLALSGLASYSGRAETGPVLSATQIADIAGGSHHAVMAILAAVYQRTQTGQGQYLDISMSDAALALNTLFAANTLVSGTDPEYGREMLNGGLFYDYYQTADNHYLAIGSLEPNFAIGLMKQLDLSYLIPTMMHQDAEKQSAIKQAIAEKISQKSRDQWVEIFRELDVCVEPVLSIQEAARHPHFIERNMLTTAIDEQNTQIPQINSPLPFKQTHAHRAGVRPGAHSHEVLRRIGYQDADIDALVKSGCIKV